MAKLSMSKISKMLRFCSYFTTEINSPKKLLTPNMSLIGAFLKFWTSITLPYAKSNSQIFYMFLYKGHSTLKVLQSF